MLENQGEKRTAAGFSRVWVGLSVFAAALLAYAAFLALIYGPSGVSLSTGCHWDCGWYQSIVRNGYVSEIPPTVQDLDRSNVAFFPLFPLLGRLAAEVFSLPSESALPLVSILFAAGIFTLLPFLASRRKSLLLLAYPATFYFFVAYSESVYCFLLFAGFLLLFRRGPIPALFGFGFALGLTRLTGFLVPAGVFGCLVVGLGTRKIAFDRRLFALSAAWTAGAIFGAGSFFAYSQVKFGAWDLYFQTLNVGWRKEVSVSGFFRYFSRALLKNVFPPYFAKDPTRMSWMITADTIVLYGYALFREGKTLLASARSLPAEKLLRFGCLAAGLAHLLVTTLGDSGELHRWGNGMRYAMPAFYLLVFLWDEAWTPEFLKARPALARGLYRALLLFWVPFQFYYLYLFTKTTWVS